MKLSSAHANWSLETATAYFHATVAPALQRERHIAAQVSPPELVHFTARSAVFRHQVEDRPLAVKIGGPGSARHHRAEAAFDWLKLLSRHRSSGGKLSSPNAIALLPEVCALVTEWIEAPTVKQVLHNECRTTGLAALGAATRWLSCFHKLHPPVTRPFRARGKLIAAEKALEINAAHLPNADEPVARYAMKRLSEFASNLQERPTEYRVLHHDASSNNFFFNGERAIGFDLHDRRRGDPLLDYCRLIIDAHMQLPPSTDEATEYGIDEGLLRVMLENADVDAITDLPARLRIHLMSASLTRYARQLNLTGPMAEVRRTRLLSVAQTLARDDSPAPLPV